MKGDRLKRLIKKAGGVRKVAGALAVSPQFLYQCQAGDRALPKKHVDAVKSMVA